MSALLTELESVPLEEIEQWEPDRQQWYMDLLRRERILASPASFATHHSDGLWTPYRHLVYTSDAIVGMIEHDECDLLLVDEPVRHGKSELCSKWTPAWFMAKYHGQRRVGLSSYEADFARGWGRKTRDVVAEIGGEYGLKKKKDVWAQDEWELESGGGMFTAGAGGPIIGKGAHLLICDDPVKNKKEADSPTMRKDLWEWWDATWTTRRMGPGTKYLLIMSRWHLDDLMGRLLQVQDGYGLRIRRLHLPAIAGDNDELDRRAGEALCPELYDEESLHSIRKTSPIAWPAQYQQTPIAEGGGLFKAENFSEFTKIDADGETVIVLGGTRVLLDDCMIFATMDTAYTKSKTSDYTAVATWAVPPQVEDRPQNLILLDIDRVQINAAGGARHSPLVEKVWNRYPKMRWIGLEKIAASYSLFHEAQRTGVIMRWLIPDRNKVARAETAVALTEQGRFWIPREAEWKDIYIEEMIGFPSAAHDDQVDVTSYAANELVKRTVRGKRHKKDVPLTIEEQVWDKVKRMNSPKTHDPVLGTWRGG